MEELFAHALLYAAGLGPEETYAAALHALFSAHPDSGLLLSLECETDPYAAARLLQRHFTCHPLDRSRFGPSLMDGLRRACPAVPDLRSFTSRLYILWTYLPAPLDREPPFQTLSCAGDPLSWGGEAQTRQLCEAMLHYYDGAAPQT